MRNFLLAAYFFTLATSATAQYSLDVRKPQLDAHAAFANQIQNSDVMKSLIRLVNTLVTVDREIPVITKSCGQPNAFYVPGRKEIILCYDLMVDSQSRLVRSGVSGGVGVQTVYAETAFILLHEIGHHLIHEYQLPVLGQAEDAADKIATFILLNSDGDEVLKRATTFFITRQRGIVAQVIQGEHDYSDSHGLPQQRLANLVCWGAGKNPSYFSDLIPVAKLSRRRLQSCASEFAAMKSDLQALLGTRLRTHSANEPVPSSPSAFERLSELAQMNQCTGCHRPNDYAMGPPLSDMAKRYSDEQIREKLTRKIQFGSGDSWGGAKASPMPKVLDEDIDALSKWVSAYR